MLKSYIPGIDSLIYPKSHYGNLFVGKLVNGLHDWIEKHPIVIQSTNVSESLPIIINSTLVRK